MKQNTPLIRRRNWFPTGLFYDELTLSLWFLMGLWFGIHLLLLDPGLHPLSIGIGISLLYVLLRFTPFLGGKLLDYLAQRLSPEAVARSAEAAQLQPEPETVS